MPEHLTALWCRRWWNELLSKIFQLEDPKLWTAQPVVFDVFELVAEPSPEGPWIFCLDDESDDSPWSSAEELPNISKLNGRKFELRLSNKSAPYGLLPSVTGDPRELATCTRSPDETLRGRDIRGLNPTALAARQPHLFGWRADRPLELETLKDLPVLFDHPGAKSTNVKKGIMSSLESFDCVVWDSRLQFFEF